MLPARYGSPMGQKALSDRQQVYKPNMAKIWQKTAKKCTKLAVNHQNVTNFSQRVCFSDISAQANHFKGLKHDPNLHTAATTKFSPECADTARKNA